MDQITEILTGTTGFSPDSFDFGLSLVKLDLDFLCLVLKMVDKIRIFFRKIRRKIEFFFFFFENCYYWDKKPH